MTRFNRVNCKCKRGPRGCDGDQGLIGERGPTGKKGDTGTVGNTGHTGPTGEQGPVGNIGPQGVQGEQGIIGPTGSTGPAAEPGPTGSSFANTTAVFAYTAGQNVPINEANIINFSNETIDPGNNFDNSVYTAPRNGIYQISINLESRTTNITPISSNVPSLLSLRINGVLIPTFTTPYYYQVNDILYYIVQEGLISLNVGDTVDLVLTNQTQGTVTIPANQATFTIFKITN